MKLKVSSYLSPDVQNLMHMDILSRVSNSPITASITLASKASIEVKVRVTAKEAARLADAYVINPDGITLGTFMVTTKGQAKSQPQDEENVKLIESIAIRGFVMEGDSFLVSEENIAFHSSFISDSDDESESNQLVPANQFKNVHITNLSNSFPLELIVEIEYPIEFSNRTSSIFEIQGLDTNFSASLEPGGTSVLTFVLKDSKISGVSDDIQVRFIDKNSLSKKAKVLIIKFVDDASIAFSEKADQSNLFEKISSSVQNI